MKGDAMKRIMLIVVLLVFAVGCAGSQTTNPQQLLSLF